MKESWVKFHDSAIFLHTEVELPHTVASEPEIIRVYMKKQCLNSVYLFTLLFGHILAGLFWHTRALLFWDGAALLLRLVLTDFIGNNIARLCSNVLTLVSRHLAKKAESNIFCCESHRPGNDVACLGLEVMALLPHFCCALLPAK